MPVKNEELMSEEMQMMSDEDLVKNFWMVTGCAMGSISSMLMMALPAPRNRRKSIMAHNGKNLSQMIKSIQTEMQRRHLDMLPPTADAMSMYMKSVASSGEEDDE